MYQSLEGKWSARLEDGREFMAVLPGTLEESQIGEPDHNKRSCHPDEALGKIKEEKEDRIVTRYTRKYTYEGVVRFATTIRDMPKPGKRVFLEVERARDLSLEVGGRKVERCSFRTLSTPQVFEVTGMLDAGKEIALYSDNSYKRLNREAILNSSAATDESQSNWNGLLGYLRLRMEEKTYIRHIGVYPNGRTLTVRVIIDAAEDYQGRLTVKSLALKKEASVTVDVKKGETEIVLSNLAVRSTVRLWDEYEGNLYELTAGLLGGEEKSVLFGIREFKSDDKGRITLNGRRLFLRGETNCAIFPETGHTPFSEQEWEEILKKYKSYGVNCVRFHSHCPPEEAFEAADRLGMLMQPELSQWDPVSAFSTQEAKDYYRAEMQGILLMLANHPSFVMLSFGNELVADDEGHVYMRRLLGEAKKLDPTRLYADGSNVQYGTVGCEKAADFYLSASYHKYKLRGTFSCSKKHAPNLAGYINNEYPSAMHSYDETMEEVRKTYQKPVISFEVGQYEILPDFSELQQFHGISKPDNLLFAKEMVKKAGREANWDRYVEATGEMALLAYREEVEAAMRTERMSGISLLGLQDFPGQGTALVGMMNSHLGKKPYGFAEPERFRAFFRECLPLALLKKYTFLEGEELSAVIKIANYGKEDMECGIFYTLSGEEGSYCGELPRQVFHAGCLAMAGEIKIRLKKIKKACKYTLLIMAGETKNSYPVWVYPDESPVCPDSVYETCSMDEEAVRRLEDGGIVYLSPDSVKEQLPYSINGHFTTDFWSVSTFPMQEGGMGQFIETAHPIFRDFPTEAYSNWQWWPMASQRAVILPDHVEAIVKELDSYKTMRNMAQLVECRCGNGRLMFSSMGLQNLKQYPEARALLAAIYRYMDSEDFIPEQTLSKKIFQELVKEKSSAVVKEIKS